MSRSIRLGAGAGFAGDRIDPAAQLARFAALDYLVFEVLGERTIAAANARRLAGTGEGYDPLLRRRLEATLPACRSNGTTIITNGGAADPRAAGTLAVGVARGQGLAGTRVGVVTGDDVLEAVHHVDPLLWETGHPLSAETDELVSANAYLGAAPVIEALAEGADVVIAGRLADPALYLGPLAHEFGWDLTGEPALLGQGTVVGHLLECAGQLTGGYFADPVTKPVPGLERLGFPFADVAADGTAMLAKLPGSGGLIDTRTVTEQLLYEVGDPSAYITPDVVADFSSVSLEQAGEDRVEVRGGSGSIRPDELKVTLGFRGGWLGEGQISYAGPRARQRGEHAARIVRTRLEEIHGLDPRGILIELIGTGAAFRGLAPAQDPIEVRLRVAARVADRRSAEAVGWEVESLYTNGPAAGGGARRHIEEVLAIRSCTLPRALVRPNVTIEEA
ncbi:acyclic terpene utilization AtuA family protein [Citricoccus nitrophenolicus]|uniref:acyclic terpene utilization AtuA family protein n=1 Tax=Citricoccus nitrophenolicus TaxID=863575 RepID=UPI0039B4BBB1